MSDLNYADIATFCNESQPDNCVVLRLRLLEEAEFNKGNHSVYSLAEVIKDTGAHTTAVDTVKPRFGFVN